MTETQQFTTLKRIGEGGYSSVSLINHPTFGKVACKAMRSLPISSGGIGTIEEVRIQQSLRHPNIITLYDFLFEPPLCLLFLEYMKYGSVDDCLKAHYISWQWKTQILNEVVLGMSFLHQQKPAIIHGDLTCGNILIGYEFHAKVSDFGLARMKEMSKSRTDNPLRGTLRYIAPEYFKDPKLKKRESYDVYGFAISAWEIFSERTAYYDWTTRQAMHLFVENGQRPGLQDMGEEALGFLSDLINKCWTGDEKQRPTFDYIKTHLSQQIQSIQKMPKPTKRIVNTSLEEQSSSMDQAGSSDLHVNQQSNSSSEHEPHLKDVLRDFTQQRNRQNISSDSVPFSEDTLLVSIATISDVPRVSGVTVSDEEIFVVCQSSSEIRVFDLETFMFHRNLPVPRLEDPWDITFCKNALFVGESRSKLIHRIPLNSTESASEWPIDSLCLSLSTTKSHNILVTCYSPNTLREYTTAGTLVREIFDQNSILNPLHTIQMDNDRFLVSLNCWNPHRICLVDNKGQLIKGFGGVKGPGPGQLFLPYHLVADVNEFCLVAEHSGGESRVESGGNRVVMLNSELEFVKELIPTTFGMKNPMRLCLDRKRKKLYVADNGNARVCAFHILP